MNFFNQFDVIYLQPRLRMDARIILHLFLIFFSFQPVKMCNKSPEKNMTVLRTENSTKSEENEDYDYDDMSATVDESSEEEDDSSDAFQDVEDEEMCAVTVNNDPKEQRLPEAVIIGTKKGGTRALLEFLNMHSKIKRAKKEIHFYDKRYSEGVQWYIDQMPLVTQDEIGMEKTPGYFHTSGVARRMWSVNNRSKLIIIVRHPVTRLISDYNQFRSNNLARGASYPDLESLVLGDTGSVDPGYPPVIRSVYHQHMTRWLDIFPANQIHVVDGDTFIRSPWTELEQLEQFLGLESELREDNFYFNTSKGFYCGRQEVRRLDSEWSCFRSKCLSPSKGRPKPQVSPLLITQLTQFFIPHNQKFFKLIGKQFDWNREP